MWGRVFSSSLTASLAKRLCRCQMSTIFFVVVILTVMVLAVAIVALIALKALTLSLVTQKIYI